MTPRPEDHELDALKSALEAATPAADPARRAENIALARKNFDAAQGSRAEPRQSSDRPSQGGFFKGAFDMLISRPLLGGLTATTALVAVGVLVLSPQGQQLLRPPVAPIPTITEAEQEAALDRDSATESRQQTGAEAPADIVVERGPGTLHEIEEADEMAPIILAEPMVQPLPSPAPTDGVAGLRAEGGAMVAVDQRSSRVSAANSGTILGAYNGMRFVERQYDVRMFMQCCQCVSC